MTTISSEGAAGSSLDNAVERIARRIADALLETMEVRQMCTADVIRQGVDHSTIERLLAAAGVTKLRTLVKVAHALDCDVVINFRLRGPR